MTECQKENSFFVFVLMTGPKNHPTDRIRGVVARAALKKKKQLSIFARDCDMSVSV